MTGESGRSFAEKLTHLVEQARAARNSAISYQRIAQGVAELGGPSMTGAYIQQLAKGRRVNPKMHYVQALADYFGVPAAYFFDDAVADRVDEQLNELRAEQERLATLRESDQAMEVATRAGELSPEGYRQVSELIELVHRLENPTEAHTTDEDSSS